MKVAVASDHRGVDVKNLAIEYIRELGHEAVDMGPQTTDSVDYPDFAEKVARAVTAGEFDRGVLMCGTGIGMSISANKVPGIRAALCHDRFTAERSREHNDANVLCFGAETVTPQSLKEIIETYFNTAFGGGRHCSRVDKMAALDKKACG